MDGELNSLALPHMIPVASFQIATRFPLAGPFKSASLAFLFFKKTQKSAPLSQSLNISGLSLSKRSPGKVSPPEREQRTSEKPLEAPLPLSLSLFLFPCPLHCRMRVFLYISLADHFKTRLMRPPLPAAEPDALSPAYVCAASPL